MNKSYSFILTALLIGCGNQGNSPSNRIVASQELPIDEKARFEGKTGAEWVHHLEHVPRSERDFLLEKFMAISNARDESVLPVLVAALKSQNPQIRSRAAFAMTAQASRVVSHLRTAAMDPDARVRINAVQCLGAAGPAAEAAIPELCMALKDSQKPIRDKAVESIATIGKPAVPALRQTLKEVGEHPRTHAAQALRKIGKDAAEAIPELVAAFQDDSVEVKAATISALVAVGFPAPEFLPLLKEALQHPEEHVQLVAVSALGKFEGDPKVVIPLLTEIVQKGSKNKRATAVQALARLKAEAAILALGEALGNDDANIRLSAVRFLGERGPDAAAALPTLMELFRGRDSQLSSEAGHVLKGIGKPAVPHLLKALESPTNHVWVFAFRTLTALGPDAEEAIDPLLDIVQTKSDVGLRTLAIVGLGSIDPMAKKSLTCLSNVAKEEHEEVARTAILALQHGGRPAIPLLVEVVQLHSDERLVVALRILRSSAKEITEIEAAELTPPLVAALLHQKPYFRDEARHLLLAISSRAKDAVPLLVELLNRDSPYREGVAVVLGRMGKEAIPPLLKLIQSEIEELHRLGVAGFAAMENPPPEAIPGLIRAFRYKDDSVRSAARRGLSLYREAALQPLLETLKDPSEQVRCEAICTLSILGAASKAAFPQLVEALQDPAESVRVTAAAVLRDIDPVEAAKVLKR